MEYFWVTTSERHGAAWARVASLFISFAKPGPSLLLPLRQTSKLARARRNLSVAGEILQGWTVVAFAFSSTIALAFHFKRLPDQVLRCCFTQLAKRTWTAAHTKEDASRRDRAPEARKGQPQHSQPPCPHL